jgi:hypothetical protein
MLRLRCIVLPASLLATACITEPKPGAPPLHTDRTQYVLGYRMYSAPMRVTYTNSRLDTVYFPPACGDTPVPGRVAMRVGDAGHEVFLEQAICGLVLPNHPPLSIAVAPGSSFVDTASLWISMWDPNDAARSEAAVTGTFQLVYDLCVAANRATASGTCEPLPLAERLTNPFRVVAPPP